MIFPFSPMPRVIIGWLSSCAFMMSEKRFAMSRDLLILVANLIMSGLYERIFL